MPSTDSAAREAASSADDVITATARAWLAAGSLGRAWTRASATGATAWLDGQAALADQSVDATRRQLHSLLDAQLRALPAGEPGADAAHAAIDEAMDAAAAATADSNRAIAADVADAFETATALGEVQQSALAGALASAFGVDLDGEHEEAPIRVAVGER
ncbi:MAG: hypothetical protein ABEJ31_00975 [Haloarculaceae archaeon]